MRHAAIVAILLTAAARLPAQNLKDVHGLLQMVDADKGFVTLLPARAQEPKTYNLLKRDLPITHALGHALKLDRLRPGQRVLLRVDEEQETVAALRVDDDCLWGSITALDTDGNQLAVRLGSIRRTIALVPPLRLERDGEPVQVQDLKVGQGVEVTFAPDHRQVLRVRVGTGITGTHPYATSAIAGGVIEAIDHARKRLQLISLTERYDRLEFAYDDWASAQLFYSSYGLREIDIHALTAPCRVSFYYDRDTKRISALHVDAPRLVRRSVAAFDRQQRRLTLELDDERKEEFAVAGDVRVMKAGAPAGLDTVVAGTIVNAALSLDGKEILLLLVAEK